MIVLAWICVLVPLAVLCAVLLYAFTDEWTDWDDALRVLAAILLLGSFLWGTFYLSTERDKKAKAAPSRPQLESLQ